MATKWELCGHMFSQYATDRFAGSLTIGNVSYI